MLLSTAATALDLTLGAGPLEQCSVHGIGSRVAALGYLEPSPILLAEEYGGRYYDAADGRNVAIGHGYADITAPLAGFCLGAFYRIDYWGDADGDTLDALAANHADRPFSVGRTYRLDYGSVEARSFGLKVSRVHDFQPADGWTVRLGATGSLLKGTMYREEKLAGAATATSGEYATGTAQLMRARSDYRAKDFNPFVGVGDPDGYGYSIDLAALIRMPRGYSLQLTAMDAFARMYWEDVPTSFERLDNQSVRYDANFNREAFITGVDRRGDIAHTLQPRYRAVMFGPLRPGLEWMLSDDHAHKTHFPAVGLRYQSAQLAASTEYDIETGALSFWVRKGFFSLSISSDDLEFHQAKVLGANLAFNAPF